MASSVRYLRLEPGSAGAECPGRTGDCGPPPCEGRRADDFGSMDITTDVARLVYTVLAAVAEMERPDQGEAAGRDRGGPGPRKAPRQNRGPQR